ncbi:MAG: hypothetical protein ACI8W0_000886 [Flavobacterium sp.]|jgi:hypothetical protein
MRKIVLITYLLTLLLAGGNKMHANVPKSTIAPVSSWNLISNNQEQLTSLNRTCFLSGYTDFFLDEEFSSRNYFKDSKANQLVGVKQSFFDKWYFCYNDTYDAYCCNLHCNYGPINGQSTPRYIAYNVLRI